MRFLYLDLLYGALCLLDTIRYGISCSFECLHRFHPMHIHIYVYIHAICIYIYILYTMGCAQPNSSHALLKAQDSIKGQNVYLETVQVTEGEPKCKRKWEDLATGLLT